MLQRQTNISNLTFTHNGVTYSAQDLLTSALSTLDATTLLSSLKKDDMQGISALNYIEENDNKLQEAVLQLLEVELDGISLLYRIPTAHLPTTWKMLTAQQKQRAVEANPEDGKDLIDLFTHSSPDLLVDILPYYYERIANETSDAQTENTLTNRIYGILKSLTPTNKVAALLFFFDPDLTNNFKDIYINFERARKSFPISYQHLFKLFIIRQLPALQLALKNLDNSVMINASPSKRHRSTLFFC